MNRLFLVLSFYLCATVLAPVRGGAVPLYLKPYAFLDRPVPLLKELVFPGTAGEAGSPADENQTTALPFLNLSLDKLTVTRLSLVPVRLIRQALDEKQSASFVLIGQRIALIPTHAYPPPLLIFYKELLLYLNTLDACQDGRLEVEITALPACLESLVTAGDNTGVLHNAGFKALELEKHRNYLSGEAVILCTLPSGWEGDSAVPLDTSAKTRTASLRLHLTHYVPVAALKQAGKKGESIGPEQLDFTEVDIRLLNAEPLTADDKLQGRYYLKKNLPSGAVLTKADLEPGPGVKAGEMVKLAFVKGSIYLQMPGKAYTSGKQGEVVTVGHAATKQRFKGMVTDTGEVKIVID